MKLYTRRMRPRSFVGTETTIINTLNTYSRQLTYVFTFLLNYSLTSRSVNVYFYAIPVSASEPRCSFISMHLICLLIDFHISTCVLR